MPSPYRVPPPDVPLLERVESRLSSLAEVFDWLLPVSAVSLLCAGLALARMLHP